ncbi:MAG TPA: CAP domain-containing protein [Nocardioidaceae bacterium]|nr:CAP domain-containing protein [Nocardioidaceae bacterium]
MMIRTFVRAILALAFAATLFGTTSATASAEETSNSGSTTTTAAKAMASPAMDPEVYERKVQYWINQVRLNRGLSKVRWESCTDTVAERWSSYLARTLEFFHQDLGALIDGCNARYAGETLAKGPIGPRGIVRAWMNSDGHRAILLSSKPKRIGVGAYADENGYWVVAANFSRF